MSLSRASVIPYLLQRQLVSPQAVVDGEVRVTDNSSRNHNFKVEATPGNAYLLKQGATAEGQITVALEADFYTRLQSDPGAGRLAEYLPRSYGYDPAEQVLILEWVQNTRNLREFHLNHGSYPTEVAEAVARFLATLHCSGRAPDDWTGTMRKGPGFPAWAPPARGPAPGIVAGLLRINPELAGMIQNYGRFCELLEQASAPRQSKAPIHGDIKWDNVLLVGTPLAGQPVTLKVVDWELLNLGDPCWDAGSFFVDYLALWVFSSAGLFPARISLESLQPAMQAFWQTYAGEMRLGGPAAAEWLRRTIECTGLRLVQHAFEIAQVNEQAKSVVTTLLQLSWNILEGPVEAAAQLLGIRVREEVPA